MNCVNHSMHMAAIMRHDRCVLSRIPAQLAHGEPQRTARAVQAASHPVQHGLRWRDERNETPGRTTLRLAMARAPLRRVLVALAAVTGMAAGMSTVSAAANTSGTTIHFVNQCGAEVAWFDGSSSRALADNASFSTVLAGGDNAAYRAGVTSDATREFTHDRVL